MMKAPLQPQLPPSAPIVSLSALPNTKVSDEDEHLIYLLNSSILTILTHTPLHSNSFGTFFARNLAEVARQLVEQKKAYPCFCSDEELNEERARQEASGEMVRYGGKWRDADPAVVEDLLSKNTPHTIRFKIPKGSRVIINDVVRGTIGWDADASLGDFVILRSSGIPVYNFCVAVDDASMAVTMVIRAEEVSVRMMKMRVDVQMPLIWTVPEQSFCEKRVA